MRWNTRRRWRRMRREAMRMAILSELNHMGDEQLAQGKRRIHPPRDALGRVNAQCIYRWPDGSIYTIHMN